MTPEEREEILSKKVSDLMVENEGFKRLLVSIYDLLRTSEDAVHTARYALSMGVNQGQFPLDKEKPEA